MGGTVDLILEGILCQNCGEYLEDSLGEFPQSCSNCKNREKKKENKKRSKNGIQKNKGRSI